MEGLSIFQTVMSFITAICVAVIGYLANKSEKANKRREAEEADYKAKLNEVQKSEESRRKSEMSKVTETLEDLKQSVDDIQDEQKSIHKSIDRLGTLTQYTLEYSNEINNALMNLGECIINQESPTAIRAQMQAHRDRANELSKKLYDINL